MNHQFKIGDQVCYRAAFLRSVSWYTNVPKYGIVRAVDTLGSRWNPSALQILDVDWCEFDAPSRIIAPNLILFSERSKEPA